MIADGADALKAISLYVSNGAQVLTDAAKKLAAGRPLSTQEYDELAAACMALTTMFATRAAMSRATPESPERTD